MKTKLISASAAAEIAGVTSQTIRNLCKQKLLSHKVIRGKYYVLSEEEIKRYAGEIEFIEVASKDIYDLANELSEKRKEYQDKLNVLERDLREMGFVKSRICKMNELLLEIADLFEKEGCISKSYACVMKKYLATGLYSGNEIGGSKVVNNFNMLWHRIIYKVRSAGSYFQSLRSAYDKVSEELKEANAKIAVLESFLKNEDARERLEQDITSGAKKARDIQIVLKDQDFSIRTLNCLACAEIFTLGDLLNVQRVQLMRMRNFGKKSLAELDEFCNKLGYKIGEGCL